MKELLFQRQDNYSESDADIGALATQFGGEITGPREIVAPVPGGGEMTIRVNRNGSLYIYDCSGSWAAAKRAIAPLAPPVDPFVSLEKSQRALQLWDDGMPIHGTPVETYLRSRSITTLPPSVDEVLRWHPRCPFGSSVTGCMLALFRDVESNKPMAVHRTNLATRERMALGPIKGAAIKLWLDPIDRRLVVGEGIETVLAAATLPWREPLFPAWAATVAFNIRKLPIIKDVERLVILVDNDQRGTGQSAAAECRWRWISAGRSVVRLTPKVSGEDFNDIARKGSRS